MKITNENILKDPDLKKIFEAIPDCPNLRKEFFDHDHRYTQEEINSYTVDELEGLLDTLYEDADLYDALDEDKDDYDKTMEQIHTVKKLIEGRDDVLVSEYGKIINKKKVGIIMNYTSAQAAKLLSKLQQDHANLAAREEKSKTFLASVGEDAESVRPAYDYEETKGQLNALEAKIRRVKHAINQFNTTTVIPEFHMTVDEMLVYIPQLSQKKAKLKEMANAMPKARCKSYERSNIIDYQYINYDLEQVKADLDEVTEALSAAQLALDLVNHTKTFEIDL